MTSEQTTRTMDRTMGENGENATLVESSPYPFTKAAEAAIRAKNKNKALHQAALFMEEADSMT